MLETLTLPQPELLSLLSSRDFGRYANEQGDMNVCFISNNDITGGNSGSAMFNGKGELLGLAFDGNWEAMSSDIVFEPDFQRCIGVMCVICFYYREIRKSGESDKENKIKGEFDIIILFSFPFQRKGSIIIRTNIKRDLIKGYVNVFGNFFKKNHSLKRGIHGFCF